MRISLSFKIIGSFALIVLLSLAAAVGTGNRLTRSRYNDFAYQLDLNRAESLSTVLGEWTDEAGTSDMPPPFPPPGALYFLPSQDKSSGFRMMDRMMSMDHMGLDRMVVTDLTGRVLLDTANYGRVRLSPENNESILIRHGEVEVGYIYMGRMIPDSRRPADASFLRSAGMMTWIITGVIFIFAMVLGLILTKHIIGPVKTLNAAAREVEGGDLSVRVPENRSDELGELSRGFNSMTESLESADKQRRRLIADSAHELRTPVSLIRARIEMMEEGIYPMDEANLSALSTESERMTHL
ncbi:MAG: HAMP domain-containing protein, partial [Spirochaetaceae bacterium]|nr:HAMP domain-containing protein [Spirochaetaceae bacterium]